MTIWRGRLSLVALSMLVGSILVGSVLAGCSGSTARPRGSAPPAGPTVSSRSASTSATTGRPGASSSTADSRTTGSSAPTGPTACTNASVVASWPTARKAEQVLVVPVLAANPAVVQVAASFHAGGVLLLGSVPPGSQLVAALHPVLAGPDQPRPFVMVDQEGGGVQRLDGDVGSIPWPRQMAATMTPTQVRQVAEALGRQMASLGVGVDLAPVLDLDGGAQLSASDPDGPRSFSTDPSVAATYGEAFASGLRAGGVLAVAKHFPGLGGSTGNTDYGAASTPPLSRLRAGGLIPFQRALSDGVTAVMVANATVPGLTVQPASLSAQVISGLLRSDLKFGGLVMTDSLSAGAIRAAGYSLASATVAALQAGADMVLFGSTLTPADTAALAPGPLAAQTQALVDAVTKAVGSGALQASRLDQAALHSVLAKGVDLCRQGHG